MTNTGRPEPDLREAERFLDLIAPGERVTFQTFDEDDRRKKARNEAAKAAGRKPRDPLALWKHGTLAEHAELLGGFNARAAGVFWMVNAGNGRGRNEPSVQRVRALFVDLDGSPLEPIHAASLPPHCIIESSAGRWHAYWRIADCPLDRFKPLQQALAARFAADVKVCDLPRVMRLPGFDHRKGEPFRSRILSMRDAPAYTLAELVAAFDLEAPTAPTMTNNATRKRRTLPDVIPKGERNNTLLSLAGGLARRGYDLQAVADRLQTITAERCKPEPLCASEVDAIAARAIAYGSNGFAKLPHALLDSPAWKSNAPPVHDIIVMAFRRFDGDPLGNIALTFADFAGRPGFGNRETFYMHRNAAIASGILVRVSEGRNSQTGRRPDLFAIASKWLHNNSAKSEKPTMPQVGKADPYIDVQLLGDLATDGVNGRNPNPKKDKAA